jgi:hypothetical protein
VSRIGELGSLLLEFGITKMERYGMIFKRWTDGRKSILFKLVKSVALDL